MAQENNIIYIEFKETEIMGKIDYNKKTLSFINYIDNNTKKTETYYSNTCKLILKIFFDDKIKFIELLIETFDIKKYSLFYDYEKNLTNMLFEIETNNKPIEVITYCYACKRNLEYIINTKKLICYVYL